MARDRAYDAALRSAFGRVTNVTPEQAREAADLFDQKAAEAGPDGGGQMFERAAQLREWAAAEDERGDDAPHVVEDRDDAPKAKAAAKPKGGARKGGKGRAKRAAGKAGKRVRRGPIGRAVSDVGEGGEQAAAGSIRSAGDLFWVWLTFALAIGLLATAVRNPDRLKAGWEQVADVVARFIDPWSADGDSGGKARMSDTTTTNQTARLIRV